MESQRLVSLTIFQNFWDGLLYRVENFLLGDFNFHVDDPENDAGAAKLSDLLNLHNLRQHVLVATHRNKHIVDLVITREGEQILLNHWFEDSGLSDHFFIHCNLSFDKPQPEKIEKVYRKICDMDI